MATDTTLRSAKGSPLTHAEVDANFENLKETADKKANTEALGVEADDTNMGNTAGGILSDDASAKPWFRGLEAATVARPTTTDLAKPHAAPGAGEQTKSG